MSKFKYSICVANLNMGNTIIQALSSVLDALDQRFEMVVVDDGSSDDSIEKLELLKSKYANLRTIYLEKDKNRTLAKTRNISVEAAEGEYCLMHIDCDDFWYPFLMDFVKVFHLIENVKKTDFLLKGHQVNMGKKDFLIKNGPYKFGHMVEDRDMWLRMAKLNALVPLEHVIFRTRMPLSRKQKLQKKFILTGTILRDEIRTGNKYLYYVTNIWRNYMNQPLDLRMYKVLIFPFCYMKAKKLGPIENMKSDPLWEDLVAAPVKNAKTLFEMYHDLGQEIDEKTLTPAAVWIFSHNSRQEKIENLPRTLSPQN
jgi:glycosyltransferase involved in cell wall biosynthesis